MSIVVQFNVDEATLRGLEWLCRERDMLPAELIAEIVSEYVKTHASLEDGTSAMSRQADQEAVDALLKKHAVKPGYFGSNGASSKTDDPAKPDPLAAILVERLGWAPDDPRIVNRRRGPLDAIVGIAGDAEPVDDVDEVIYGR